MRYFWFCSLFVSLFVVSAYAQNVAEAEQALTRMKAALGGESQLQAIRSLSFTAAQRKLLPGKEIRTDLKVEWLLPDKFFRQETTEAQKSAVVMLTQILNGTKVSIDRRINSVHANDDASPGVRQQQTTTPPQIANSSIGMKETASGVSTVRTSSSTSPVTTERSVLGMTIPRPSGGKDSDTDLQQMADERRAAQARPTATNNRPDIDNPGIRAEMERDFRDDFRSLALVLLPTAAASLQLTHFEVMKTPDGKVIEAIDLIGQGEYQARLFLDQATHLPVMLSYRALRNPQAGYVTGNDATGLQEIAVQLFFSDYQKVSQVMLPLRVIKAVNGIQVEEWKVTKYKINPELKPARFAVK